MAVFKMMTIIAVVLMFGYSAAVEMKAGPLANMDMSHRLCLDQDNKFLMLWTPEEDEIIFEIQVETTGYAGLGFSPGGEMADIIIGWVADGMVYLHDQYATGKSMLIVDEMQNVDLLGGYQNDTHTVLRFKRAWNTYDDEDIIISGYMMRFIWTYSDNDPSDENSIPYYSKRSGSISSGSASLYTKKPRFRMHEFGDDVKSWDDLISPNEELVTISYPEFKPFPPLESSSGLDNQETGGPQSEEETQVLGTIPEGDLTHRVNLDQGGNFIMLWTPDKDLITFEVQVATTGYVGLGFSSNGGMKGSDIILGWVDDNTGECFLQDRYATGKKMPEVDTDDNVELLGGYQNDTHTVLRFRRPWDTCDEEHDMIITEDTIRIIWAFGDEDPADNGVNNIPYHSSQRGTISLYLKEPQFVLPEFGPDVKAWELRSPNVELPNDLDTLYWCKIFKMPPVEKKNYIIGYEPVFAEGNLEHVHHILLYECHLTDSDRHFEKFLDADGSQCFGPNMPPSWYHCASPIIAWAIGGKGSIFQDNVGFPLGEEHGGATYFLMEMHYDNPNLKEGVVDNSGLKIYHTEEEKIEASIFVVGHDIVPTMIIPPGQEWVTVGHCSGECTESGLPPDGIKVLSGILHSHLLGVNMTLRHIRGNSELPIPLKDSSYDFNLQETRATDVTILPGDKLITECGYDSTKKKRTTFGGFGTDEEMCLAFLVYYPKIDFQFCASKPKMGNIFKSIGIEEIYNPDSAGGFDPTANGIDEEAETELANRLKNGDLSSQVLQKVNLALALKGIVVKSPTRYENQSLYDILSNKETWKDEEVARRLQDAVYSGDHEAQCTDRQTPRLSVEELMTISYPDFKPFPPPESSCGLSNTGAENPLTCPPETPSCTQFNFPSNVFGNKPF